MPAVFCRRLLQRVPGRGDDVTGQWVCRCGSSGLTCTRVGVGGAARLAVLGPPASDAPAAPAAPAGRNLTCRPMSIMFQDRRRGAPKRGVPWTDKAPPNSHPSEQPNDCDEPGDGRAHTQRRSTFACPCCLGFETSMKCWLCDREFTKECDSKEHIVPKALGGRKTVTGFICNDCNTHRGRTWDAAVTKQLEFFAVLLNIKREGRVPHMDVKTVKGRRLFLQPGNKPVAAPTRPKEVRVGDHIRVSMQGHNRRNVAKGIEGLMRKYPNALIKELRCSEGKDYDKTPYEIDLSYGGPDLTGRL